MAETVASPALWRNRAENQFHLDLTNGKSEEECVARFVELLNNYKTQQFFSEETIDRQLKEYEGELSWSTDWLDPIKLFDLPGLTIIIIDHKKQNEICRRHLLKEEKDNG